MARKSRINSAAQFEQAAEAAWNAALYLRLSVEDGDDMEQNSIGNQKKLCLSFLEHQQNISIFNIYTDHGFSGMNYKRPGFIEMYEAIEQGLINCVIVKDISRFGREYIATSEFLQRTFPQMGVRFISINDDYDSLQPSADIEGLLLPFKMILNDSYAKDTSKKIRSSITAKMNAGEFLPSSGSVPYGYLRNPQENTFDVDPEAAPIVRRIFLLRAEGTPFNTIAKLLNTEGIPSPGKLRCLRGVSQSGRFAQSEWIRGTIRKITSDPVYLGNRIHGKVKRDRLGEDKTKRDPSEWQVIPGTHMPLISEELYHQVQEVNRMELQRRGELSQRAKPAEDFRDLLRGKLFCGDCGGQMIAMKRNQRVTSSLSPVIFYQCNAYKYSNLKRCFSHYINESLIVSALRTVLDQQVALTADIEKVLQFVDQSPVVQHPSGNSRLQSIRVKRRNLESKQERLLTDLTDGLLNRDEYEYTKARYAKEHTALLEEEREAELEALTLKETYHSAQKWLNSLKKYRRLPVLNREIVDLIVERILIYSDKRIEIVLSCSDPYQAFAVILKETETNKHAG